MSKTECLLEKIYQELRLLNRRSSVRTNSFAIIEIDTSDTTRRTYNLSQIFGTPSNILATTLTVVDLGGGFTLNVNSSDFQEAAYGYAIDNEEIYNIEVIGNGVAGTGKIRIGAWI